MYHRNIIIYIYANKYRKSARKGEEQYEGYTVCCIYRRSTQVFQPAVFRPNQEIVLSGFLPVSRGCEGRPW